jgi:hypothetical protein
MAHHPGKHLLQWRESPRNKNDAFAPVNLGDSPQNFSRLHWWIILRHGIAARNPLRAVILDQPMDENPFPQLDQHHISTRELARTPALDHEHVAGPDRGKHTGSERLDPDAASGPQKRQS